MTGSASNVDRIYTLLHLERTEADIENTRLTNQYFMLRDGLRRESPVPPELDLHKVSAVLDVAAGNCIWSLDLTSQPEIQMRLKSKDEDLELYACDIDLGKFPPSDLLAEQGITTFQHDVTKPFPEDMKHRFDLIHMGLLIGALTSKQWPIAIQNLRDALRPGGYLLLVEYQGVPYPAEQSMPPPSWKFGEVECLKRNSDHYLHKQYQLLQSTFVGAFDMVADLAYWLPLFLKDARMQLIELRPIIYPLGRCLSLANNDLIISQKLSSTCLKNLMLSHQASLRYTLKSNPGKIVNPLTGKMFRVHTGSDPASEFHELDEYLEWLRGKYEEEGAYCVYFEVLARVPDE